MQLRCSYYFFLFLAGSFAVNAAFGSAWAAGAADAVAKLKAVPDAQRQTYLEAEAKKEGGFSFYGTMSTDHSTRVLNAFRRRYPFLSINHYRSGSTALLSKILAESRGGKHDFDTVDQEPGAIYELQRVGLIEKYLSPNRKDVRDEMMDKEGYRTAGYHVEVVIAYNTQLVRKEELPKSYQDLLNPRWKGRMVVDSQDADWFHTILEYFGEEKGLTFMKRLAAQNPEMRTGHSLAAQLLAAGEYHIAPSLYGYRISEMMTQGAPLDFIYLDPVISKPRFTALAKNAPHPNAAMLFLDWMISAEAQTIVGQELGRGPVRKGMKSKYPRLDYPKFVVVSADTLAPIYKKRLEEYQKIFGFR
jgi:iron(III) transport system substrate-binding protein